MAVVSLKTSLHPLRILSFKEDYRILWKAQKCAGVEVVNGVCEVQAHAHKTYTCLRAVHGTDQRVFTILLSCKWVG